MSEIALRDVSFYLTVPKFQRVYLRRNVRKTIRHLTMRSAFSVPKSSSKVRHKEEILASGSYEDEEGRPPKRRRINIFEDDSIWSRLSDKLEQQRHGSPSYNGSRMRRPDEVVLSDYDERSQDQREFPIAEESSRCFKRGALGSIIEDAPHKFEEALRLDFIELIPTQGNLNEADFDLSSGRELPFEMKCRCCVAIFYGNNDFDPGGDINLRSFVEICRVNKFCTVRLERGRNGHMSRKLILSEPFIFTPENIYVNRKKRKTNRDPFLEPEYDYSFGFADMYSIQVFIDPPLEFNEDWPPIAIPLHDSASRRNRRLSISKALDEKTIDKDDLQLMCRYNVFVDSHTSPRATPVQLLHKNGTTKQTSDYALKFDMEWTLPTTFTAAITKTMRTEPSVSHELDSINLRPPDSPHQNVRGPESPVRDRSHRARSAVITYNLKALSAQAQGKSPRKTAETAPEHMEDGPENEESTLKYLLVPEDFARKSSLQPEITLLAGCFRCVLCLCENACLDELRLHMRTQHSTFNCGLRSRAQFYLEHCKSLQGVIATTDCYKHFLLGMPDSHFDFEAYLKGDDSWVHRRQGLPVSNHQLSNRNSSSVSTTPQDSRKSSPNTSLSVTDEPEAQKPPEENRKPRSLIPKTSKPLYHSITKQILLPGTELSDSEGEMDTTWLHHRKHYQLNEFEDVSPVEKEYLRQWNLFMVEKRLSSDYFIPQAVLEFVETHKTWLVERRTRKVEFMKHLESFRLRGVLGLECIQQCVVIMRAALMVLENGGDNRKESDKETGTETNKDNEKQLESQQSNGIKTEAPRRRGDCICRERVDGPGMILCSGYTCQSRFFHVACAEKQTPDRPVTKGWLCDECFALLESRDGDEAECGRTARGRGGGTSRGRAEEVVMVHR